MDQFELARENLDYLLERIVENTELRPDMDMTISNLTNVSTEQTAIVNEWKEFCDSYGLAYNQVISAEAIVSKKEGETSLFTRFISQVVDSKDNVLTAFNLFSGYNAAKLEKYLAMIKTGELIPKKEISVIDQDKIANKYASFFVLGNDMHTSKDLIAYMNEPVEALNSSRYENLFKKLLTGKFDNLPAPAPSLSFDKMKMQLKLDKEDHDKILMSFLVKRFYHKLYMYSFVVADHSKNKEHGGAFDNDHILGNNIDIVDIPYAKIEKVRPFDKQNMIALLEWGIKNNDYIKKAITESKKLFLTYGVKSNLGKLIANMVPIPGYGAMWQIILFRAFDAIINHIGNVSRDMIHYDNQIIQLVNMMYEKK